MKKPVITNRTLTRIGILMCITFLFYMATTAFGYYLIVIILYISVMLICFDAYEYIKNKLKNNKRQYNKINKLHTIIQKLIHGEDDSWRWLFRIIILGTFIALGGFAITVLNIQQLLLKHIENSSNNEILISSVTISIFALIANTGRWLTSTHDKKKESRDRFEQIKQSRKEQNETRFSNAINLLHNDNNKSAQALGLIELSMMKQNKIITSERIDNSTRGIKLQKIFFRKSEFEDANFENTIFENTIFQGSSFFGTNFHGADFTNTSFLNNPWFVDSDFSYANFCNADLSQCVFQDGEFGAGSVDKFKFKNIDFQDTNFEKCTFYDTKFYSSKFSNAELEVTFQGARFWSCNFEYTQFKGINFGKSYFSHYKDKMKNARYNKKTKFPKNFDPKKHGMYLVD